MAKTKLDAMVARATAVKASSKPKAATSKDTRHQLTLHASMKPKDRPISTTSPMKVTAAECVVDTPRRRRLSKGPSNPDQPSQCELLKSPKPSIGSSSVSNVSTDITSMDSSDLQHNVAEPIGSTQGDTHTTKSPRSKSEAMMPSVRVFPIFDVNQTHQVQHNVKRVIDDDKICSDERKSKLARLSTSSRDSQIESGTLIPFEPVNKDTLQHFLDITSHGCVDARRFGIGISSPSSVSHSPVVGITRASMCAFFRMSNDVIDQVPVPVPSYDSHNQCECDSTTTATPACETTHPSNTGLDRDSPDVHVVQPTEPMDTSSIPVPKTIGPSCTQSDSVECDGANANNNMINAAPALALLQNQNLADDANQLTSHGRPCSPCINSSRYIVTHSTDTTCQHDQDQKRRMNALNYLFQWPRHLVKTLCRLAATSKPECLLPKLPSSLSPDSEVPLVDPSSDSYAKLYHPDVVVCNSPDYDRHSRAYLQDVKSRMHSMTLSTSFSGIDTPSIALAMLAAGVNTELGIEVTDDSLKDHIAGNLWGIEWLGKSQEELLRHPYGPHHVYGDISEFWLNGIHDRIDTLVVDPSLLRKTVKATKTVKRRAYCRRCRTECTVPCHSGYQYVYYFILKFAIHLIQTKSFKQLCSFCDL